MWDEDFTEDKPEHKKPIRLDRKTSMLLSFCFQIAAIPTKRAKIADAPALSVVRIFPTGLIKTLKRLCSKNSKQVYFGLKRSNLSENLNSPSQM